MQPRILTGAASIVAPAFHVRVARIVVRNGRRLSGAYRRSGSPQSTSRAGVVDLLGHEAIVLSSYYDGVGVLTIYVGHTAAAGMPIPVLPWRGDRSVPTAIAVLRIDLAKYERGVNAAFTRPLSQAQFDAALSFHYNTGAIGVASWVKLFNAGKDAAAETAFMAWDRPASIIPRRRDECRLFFDGIYSNAAGVAALSPANDAGVLDWHNATDVAVAPYLA